MEIIVSSTCAGLQLLGLLMLPSPAPPVHVRVVALAELKARKAQKSSATQIGVNAEPVPDGFARDILLNQASLIPLTRYIP